MNNYVESINMGATTDFVCSKCAKCCKNLIETGNEERGLTLTENETKLFPPKIVAPKLGIGLKTPEKVILYQLTVRRCPYLDEQNKCQIYTKRPLMCQSFPIIAGTISNRCSIFSYRKPGIIYAEPYSMKSQLKASNILEKYIDKAIRRNTRKDSIIWEYSLKTKNWINRGICKI